MGVTNLFNNLKMVYTVKKEFNLPKLYLPGYLCYLRSVQYSSAFALVWSFNKFNGLNIQDSTIQTRVSTIDMMSRTASE